ncbi:MAG: hypothetical protein ACW964_09890 [Candidatus Hodarchaeales archaeon]|jgi:hypothetical protein
MRKLFLLIPALVSCLNLTVVVPGPDGSSDTIIIDTTIVHIDTTIIINNIVDTVVINDLDKTINSHIVVRIAKGDTFMPGQWYFMKLWYQFPPLSYTNTSDTTWTIEDIFFKKQQ